MKEVYTLFIYYMIYSFIGWVLESVYKSILQKKLVNSGFLAGPFCPIYGYGALIMYLSLKDVTNNIFILFIYGMVALSVFEYIVGLFLELVFRTKYWDYSDKKFNIQGRVCLLNSFYWGILGIVFMRVIHPAVESFVVKIPDLYVYFIVGAGIVYFIIDTITSTVKVININNRLAELEKITNEIKERMEALNARNLKQFEKIIRLRRVYKYNVLKKLEQNKKKDGILEQLRETQQEVQAKIEKRMKRLQKAFPTMKSERLSNFWKGYKKS